MIYRIYPLKDTTITNDTRLDVRMTASNLGFSEELDVYKVSGLSGSVTTLVSSSLSRALVQFDFSAFSALTASSDIPSSGSFRLKMFHKTAGQTLPSSFDLVLAPVSAAWDEGHGVDVDDLSDSGFANWVQPTSTTYWTRQGGDFITSSILPVHFDLGTEDIDVDVTSMVNTWLTGGLTNYGLSVAMTSTIESDSNYTDYYIKKFYSRHSSYEDRIPYIEYRVDDSVRDDRQNMRWSRTGSLCIYNIVGGDLVDLPAQRVYVTVSDASGALLYLTGSHVSTGIYSASFALSTGSFSGSLFYDAWGSGSFSFVTGNFTIAQNSPSTVVKGSPLSARIRDLRDEYRPEDVVEFEVIFRKRPNRLAVVTTGSVAVPYIVEKAYYAIENDSTRERVVPFGTGSNHTKLSYDGAGNKFKFYMSCLHSQHVYRVLFLVDEGGRQQVIDEGLKFKIV